MMSIDDLRRIMYLKSKSFSNVKRRNSSSSTSKKISKNNEHRRKDEGESCARRASTPTRNNKSTNNTFSDMHSPKNITTTCDVGNIKSISDRNRPRAVVARRAKHCSHRNSCNQSDITPPSSSSLQEENSENGQKINRLGKSTDHWYYQSSISISKSMSNIPDTASYSSGGLSGEQDSKSCAYKLDESLKFNPRSKHYGRQRRSKNKQHMIPTDSKSCKDNGSVFESDASCDDSVSVRSYATTGRIHQNVDKCYSNNTSNFFSDRPVTSCRTYNAPEGRPRSINTSIFSSDRSATSGHSYDSSVGRRHSCDSSVGRRPRAVMLRENKMKLDGSLQGYNHRDVNTKPQSDSNHGKIISSGKEHLSRNNYDNSGISNLIQSLRSQIISLHLNEGSNSTDAYTSCYVILEQLEKSHSAAISDFSSQLKHWQNNAKMQQEKEIDEAASKTINDALFSHSPAHLISADMKEEDNEDSSHSHNPVGVLA